jgi:antitoxin CcdA
MRINMRMHHAHGGLGMRDKPARRKRAVNLSIDSALLDEAKAAGTNMSAVLEKALSDEWRERRWRKWREDNRDATESMNEYVRKHGLWSKKYRVW